MGVRFGRVALTFASSDAKPPLEDFQRLFVLGMMTRSRGELDVAQFPQLASHGRYVERYSKLLLEPLDQVDQPPANNTVDCRNRTLLDDLHKRPALGIIEDRGLAGSLAVKRPIRAQGPGR